MEQKPQTALAQEIEKAELLTGIRHAFDLSYRRVCQAARTDWERLFGSDPADTCVTVRSNELGNRDPRLRLSQITQATRSEIAR